MPVPGMPAAVGGASAIELAFRASATSSAETITIPASAEAGDWAILFDWAQGSSGIGEVIPAGWTAIPALAENVSQARAVVSTRILTPGDPDTAVAGMNEGFTAKIMTVFSGGISGVNVVANDAQITSGNPAAQMVAADEGVAPLIVFGFAGANMAVGAFSTQTPAFDAEIAQGRARAGYKIYNSAPQGHTIDTEDEGDDNYLGTAYVELA